jgi:uncharacterized OB-fold protein
MGVAEVIGERKDPHGGDWTENVPQLLVRACGSCAHRWYLRRDFCPHCGSENVLAHVSEGSGTVAASTVVHRPPSDTPGSDTPFGIVLVDLDEGVRVMGRSTAGRRPGDRVAVDFRSYGRDPVPFFDDLV